MNPLELIVWAGAFAVAIVLIAIALWFAAVCISSARNAGRTRARTNHEGDQK